MKQLLLAGATLVAVGLSEPATYAEPGERRIVETTGHPAVDAALRSLANASQLAPGEQIAAYEAAHQVLQETLSSIEG